MGIATCTDNTASAHVHLFVAACSMKLMLDMGCATGQVLKQSTLIGCSACMGHNHALTTPTTALQPEAALRCPLTSACRGHVNAQSPFETPAEKARALAWEQLQEHVVVLDEQCRRWFVVLKQLRNARLVQSLQLRL